MTEHTSKVRDTDQLVERRLAMLNNGAVLLRAIAHNDQFSHEIMRKANDLLHDYTNLYVILTRKNSDDHTLWAAISDIIYWDDEVNLFFRELHKLESQEIKRPTERKPSKIVPFKKPGISSGMRT